MQDCIKTGCVQGFNISWHWNAGKRGVVMCFNFSKCSAS
jgi:hypothetical protein